VGREVPEHWDVVSAKWVYELRLGKMLQNQPTSPKDKAVPYLKAVHVGWGDVCVDELPTMWASDADTRYYGVRAGDLLVCEGGQPGRAGIVSSVPDKCILQNSLHRVRAKSTHDLGFLLYLLWEANRSGYLDSECNKATIVHFTKEKFGSLKMPWPSLDQRRHIASFLDKGTTHIDTLVSKKQCQLELLEEKRVALITRAVTKGLDPNVKMKDSGVEWLGEVPEHWKVVSLKRMARISYGLGQPPRELEDGIPLIRATDISRGAIDPSNCLRVDPTGVPTGRNAFLEPGDIIVVRSGAYTGDSALVPRELAGAVAGYDMIVRCSDCLAEFMAYVLLSNSMAQQINMVSSRAAQAHLNAEQLGNCTSAFPSLEEQRSIVRYLDSETIRIDAIRDKIQHSIQLLQEYRSALISAAVTGQIDVREEVV
jgi:type I restriction enzyme S subunit